MYQPILKVHFKKKKTVKDLSNNAYAMFLCVFFFFFWFSLKKHVINKGQKWYYEFTSISSNFSSDSQKIAKLFLNGIFSIVLLLAVAILNGFA